MSMFFLTGSTEAEIVLGTRGMAACRRKHSAIMLKILTPCITVRSCENETLQQVKKIQKNNAILQ